MARREWTDAEKATALAALDANGGNVAKTARALGMSRSTLKVWAHGRATNGDVAQMHQEKKGELADELEKVARLLVGALPDKIADATLQQTATALGITVDKLLALRDEAPTQRHEMSGPGGAAIQIAPIPADYRAALAPLAPREANG